MAPESSLVQRVRDAVQPAVEDVGLLVEDVAVSSAGRRSVVRVVVDLPDGPGGVDADSLADASRAVSSALDAAEAVAGSYVLEVSTPGTSRALTSPRHFRRAVTRLVRLTLTDGSTLEGRLVAADDDLTLAAADGTRTVVPLSTVARGAIEVELTRDEGGEI
jgi:ribosome maturation factor RimP